MWSFRLRRVVPLGYAHHLLPPRTTALIPMCSLSLPLFTGFSFLSSAMWPVSFAIRFAQSFVRIKAFAEP